MLVELGHDPAEAGDLTWAVGPPIAVSVGTLLAKYGDDRVELGLKTYRARYTDVGIYECTTYPGVPEMLAALTGAGLALCVATSKRRDFADRVVDYLGLREYLPRVYVRCQVAGWTTRRTCWPRSCAWRSMRPAPRRWSVTVSHEIHAAQANALRSVGVLWGYGGQAELQQAGADVIVASPSEVAARV